ncbi:DUF3820 family protein [Biformimicrobium ophioploci]|uniref:DUF3820 family protein n=1 Tax=Biformimicrobium ophioploci TaxID=3036711 RepID=A0ABQ6LX35_9GAMM|nr:DUF3820 family protein [Microbulbifer sp. NKW57]GMG86669.1 DUF3820 family protein [Microbulbifer sp. NKW57]
MNPEDLKALATMKMPFGKYAGRVLIDLPEEYLLWFARKGEFPNGRLGELMALALEIRMEGLEGLIKPLKRSS